MDVTLSVTASPCRLPGELHGALSQKNAEISGRNRMLLFGHIVLAEAVSKWRSGASDPSTSNLLALAKLYGVSAEDLLREAAGE